MFKCSLRPSSFSSHVRKHFTRRRNDFWILSTSINVVKAITNVDQKHRYFHNHIINRYFSIPLFHFSPSPPLHKMGPKGPLWKFSLQRKKRNNLATVGCVFLYRSVKVKSKSDALLWGTTHVLGELWTVSICAVHKNVFWKTIFFTISRTGFNPTCKNRVPITFYMWPVQGYGH